MRPPVRASGAGERPVSVQLDTVGVGTVITLVNRAAMPAAVHALLAPHVRTDSDDHDELDALMAAVVARGPSRWVAHAADACDGSTIWVLGDS